MATKQTNIAANPARGLIFFEGQELCYNYKTQQWTRVPAYDTYGMFSVNSNNYDIGLVVFSSGSVELQEQQLTDVAQDATLSTGAVDLSSGERSMVTGVRPRWNGDGTITVQVGSQDTISESTDWTTATSVNSRSNIAAFRKEGLYLRGSVTVTGGFNQLVGLDVDFTPSGKY